MTVLWQDLWEHGLGCLFYCRYTRITSLEIQANNCPLANPQSNTLHCHNGKQALCYDCLSLSDNKPLIQHCVSEMNWGGNKHILIITYTLKVYETDRATDTAKHTAKHTLIGIIKCRPITLSRADSFTLFITQLLKYTPSSESDTHPHQRGRMP